MKNLLLTTVACLLIAGLVKSEEVKIPLIGSKAPSFEAKTTHGQMTFPRDFGKSWKILFSHPLDFTPVCTTELLELAHLSSEFKKLNVKIAVLSVDDLERHNKWVEFLESLDYKNRGTVKIDFPLIEDTNGAVSAKYGMVHPPASSSRDVRGVYIIDPNNIVRSVNFYPMEIGRNMEEYVRTVQALQTYDENKFYTPANWEQGDDVIVPYRPFTLSELETNPEKIAKDYYSLENQIWFKKMHKKVDE